MLTCCKQHAATAAAAKPKPKLPIRPAPAPKPTLLTSGFTNFQRANPLPVVKSKAPKPASTTALHQDQVKKASDFVTATKNEMNQLTQAAPPGDTTTPPTTQPSGGGNVWPSIKCQTGCNDACGTGGCGSIESMRIQYGVNTNNSPTVDFNATITIPPDYTAKDTATLQIGGGQHQKGCGWDGYKLYLRINGKPNAMGIEYGKDANYAAFDDAKIYHPEFTLRPNQTYHKSN